MTTAVSILSVQIRTICFMVLAIAMSFVTLTSNAQVVHMGFEQDVNDNLGYSNGEVRLSNYFKNPINPNIPVIEYPTDSRVGDRSISFNGSGTGYVWIPNIERLPTFTRPRTISAWAKTRTGSGLHTIAAFGVPSTGQSMFIGQSGTNLVAGAFGSFFTIPNIWTTDVWHHICLTYNGTTASLYVDGSLVDSNSFHWPIAVYGLKCYIGKNVNGNEPWNGLVDDFRIYDREVSAAEVLHMVQSFQWRVGYWPLEGNTRNYSLTYSSTTKGLTYSYESRVGGQSLSVNGTNQVIGGGNPEGLADGVEGRSICAWARTTTTAAGSRVIVSYGTALQNKAMFIGQNGTQLVGGGFSNDITYNNFWAPNVWHHICLTYDGAWARLYADGVEVAAQQKPWSLVKNVFKIGRNVNDLEYWNGLIDDVQVFSTVLTPAEIQGMASVPASPSNVSVPSTTTTSVNLTWSDNATTENSYQVVGSLTSGSGFVGVAGLSANTNSCTESGLVEGTTYYYRVRASNGIHSDFTSEIAAHTMPSAPSVLAATAGSSTSIRLNWVDNSHSETGFQIERSLSSGSGYTLVYTTAPGETVYTNTGLTPGTTYYYRVRAAYASVFSGYSNTTSAATISAVQETNYQAYLNNLAFQYQYDKRNRMTAKKVPGADWVYMVYDDRDRLVLTQDGNQRSGTTKYWTFTKYDDLNRPIATGIKDTTAALTQEQMQTVVNNFYATKAWAKFSETYVGSAAANVHGYSNKSYPVVTTSATVDPQKYLTVSYYDNYQFKSLWTGDYNYQNESLSQTVSGNAYNQPAIENQTVVGLVTGTKTKVLDGAVAGGATYLKTISYYDDKYRVIQTKSDNYKGGIDRNTSLYDFVGKVLKVKFTHEVRSVNWKDMVAVSVVGNTIWGGTTAGFGNSGAASVEVLPASQNGWVEFTASEIQGQRFIGFSDVNTDTHYNTIDYSYYMDMNGALYVFENNAQKYTVPGGYVPGDKLRIERSGTVIRFFRNASLMYSSTTPSTSALMVDLAYGAGAVNPSPIVGIASSFTTGQKIITRTFEYDHAGRLTSTWHQIDSGPTILLAKNEYNELGQLVDKKLHSTVADASNNKQSVDYRYNIRGWLTSMNNAELSGTGTNDDATDYFGMSLSYNTADTDLANNPLYNGNISAIKWSNYGDGTVKQKGYTYAYDAMNRITGSTYKEKTTAWAALTASGFAETGFTYDLNGNIKTLTRNDKRANGTMDILSYDYGTGTSQSNQLLSVSDSGDDFTGFIDDTATDANDYSYDSNGNMTRDLNKGIGASLADATNKITYNFLNLPETVTKSGNSVRYIYDATGRKLAQVVNYAGRQKQTDYAGEFVYENEALQFINHEEGRIVMSSVKLISTNSAESTTGFTPVNSTVAAVVENGEQKYVKATVTNSAARPGIFPIGNSFYVTGGERYKVRVKGYRTGTSVAYIMIKVNGSDFNFPGSALPKDWQAESWVEQIVTIPAGTPAVPFQVGVIWPSVTLNESVYVNEVEIIKLETSAPEYQYFLKDHLGNVRLTFTSQPQTESATATMEAANATAEAGKFLYYSEAIKVNHALWDHTNLGATRYATRLTGGGTNATYGLAKSLSVMPGDVVNMKVYAKYLDTNNSNWTATLNAFIGSIANGTAPAGTVVDGGAAGSIGGGAYPISPIDHGSESGTPPKAYLNYIVFNKDMTTVLNSGFARITTNSREYGQDCAHDSLMLNYTVKEPGYVYIYLSNENATAVEVYFDDFEVEHVKSAVVGMDDYYAFGLSFNSYSRENSTPNDYKYNGKEEQNELDLDWLDYGWRMYDPTIARWSAVDGKSEKYISYSPYHYAANNPVRNYDIDGNEFTEAAWSWVISMLNNLGGEVTRLDNRAKKIDKKLGGSGLSDKKRERLENRKDRVEGRRDAAQNNYDQVFNEVVKMDYSSQVYDVKTDNSMSNSQELVAGAGFDFKTGNFVIGMPSGSSAKFFAHEFKHAYQFEVGEYSVGPELSDPVYKNLLYDKHDEVAAYQRGAMFGETSYSINSLPKRYDGVATGPVDATTHPVINGIMNNPNLTAAQKGAALQRFANGTGHAFRVNGTTYYRPR